MDFRTSLTPAAQPQRRLPDKLLPAREGIEKVDGIRATREGTGTPFGETTLANAMDVLGHSTVEITMRRYQHVSAPMRRTVADGIEILLGVDAGTV